MRGLDVSHAGIVGSLALPGQANIQPSATAEAEADGQKPTSESQRPFGEPDYLIRVVSADLPFHQRLYESVLTICRGCG
ncbi:hypothetical protein [Streptomyces spirodelae]|uniref:Uncharacterized protein n=1 Tax=Streptomyces spirodelae TaxID=2812904 RepID=A0ABS3WQ18_9ACTN|nr:hypothetical protein [Streptomyces spirodelae]MBO8185198.1 hypothetical protein [Streptomyces spirodelae]